MPCAAARTVTGAPASLSSGILDTLTTATLVLDEAGLLVQLNPAAESLLRTSVRQAVGRPLAAALPAGDEISRVVELVRSTDRPHARRELELRFEDAPDTWAVFDCVVTPLEQPEAPGLLLVELRDVSNPARLRRDADLIAQQGVSRAIVHQLAHELKNPLGAIRGAAQLLEGEPGGGLFREYTELIRRETDRLVALVDTMLGPGGRPAKHAANIHRILAHVRRLLVADAAPTLEILEDYDPSLPELEVDPDQIVQAILNLGRNAVQAVGDTGRIQLRTRALTRFSIGPVCHALVARVDVEDDGPGVPVELRETLFYPLVSGRTDGTGLGLALAQDLVSRHDGLIEFTSAPGRTVFSVFLPVSSAAANGAEA